MNKWIQILLFSAIFGILGYLLGSRHHSHRSHHGHHHASCVEKGHKEIVVRQDGVDEDVEVIVKHMEDFDGDTTMNVDGAIIKMKKVDGEIEVEVNTDDMATDENGEVKKQVKIIKKIIQ